MDETEKSAASTSQGDKIDLFLVPHTRMKELVTWPLAEAASALEVQDLEPTLQAVYEAMWELKTHEYIENHLIMNRLKARLQTKRVYNEMVCNCHEDSKLLDVIDLVEKVYMAQTQTSRCKYGRLLQSAIRSFLTEFEQHMKQEESVFGPLLMENFERKELEDMNEAVLQQHDFLREKVKSEKTLVKAVKRKRSGDVFEGEDLGFSLDDLRFKKSYCQEVSDHLKRKKEEDESEPIAEVSRASELPPPPVVEIARDEIQHLPDEMLVMVFSHLSPKDLLACSAVCKRWNKVAFSSVLWKALYPTQWTRGVWSFDYISPKDSDIPQSTSSSMSSLTSSTESLDQIKSDSSSSSEGKLTGPTSTHENRIFQGIIRHLLPKVGSYVSTLILSASFGISNFHIRGMLRQLPNVRHVDLSYTNVSAEAIIGLAKTGGLRNLEELNLSGCRYVSDLFLDHLARCYTHPNSKGVVNKSHLRKLILSGCKSVTSVGIQRLDVHKSSLQELDLSGCYTIDGVTLSLLARGCSRLCPEKLSYCNEIEDGPYFDRANGCLNLDCGQRFCCQKLVN